MDIKNLLRSYTNRPSLFLTVSGLFIGVILIIGYQSFKASERTTCSEFNQRQLLIANQTVAGMENYIEVLVFTLRSIAQTRNLYLFNDPVTRSIIEHEFIELQDMGVNDLGIIDANGFLRYAARAPHLVGTDFSWRKYFQRAKANASTADFSLKYCLNFIEFQGVDAGQRGLLLCVPIAVKSKKKGLKSALYNFGGLVICTFKLEMLTRNFIANLESDEFHRVYLFTDTGHLLWPMENHLFGKRVSNDHPVYSILDAIMPRMKSGQGLMLESSFLKSSADAPASALDPEMQLVAAAPLTIDEQVWPLVLVTPKSKARGAVNGVFFKQMLLMGVAVAALLIAASYALFVSNRYKRTLERDMAIKSNDLAVSHKRFISLLDELEAYVFAIDMQNFEILYANQAALKCFGEIIGKPCWRVLQVGQTGRCSFCPNRKLLSEDREPTGVNSHSWEIQNTRTKQWWQAQGRVIRWIDNREVILKVALDVTDRKLAQIELQHSHKELGTFCGIMKEIGTMESLDSIGKFLLNELGGILNKHSMVLAVFNKYRDILYVISEESPTAIIKEHLVTSQVSGVIDNLNGITASDEAMFMPPVIPDTFPSGGKQTIIPLQVSSKSDGALIIGCQADCRCEDKELDLIELILEQVSGVIKRAVRHREEIRNLQDQIENTFEFCGIVGKAPEMQVIYKLINDIAPTDATVLIQGESGTGKELVARAIHRQSTRRNKPFIVINCAAYPATLLESELFGHEKGAFTGATSQKSGRFEQASGGTVFLDEIGEVPLSAQIKLLRVLQTQKFERLGGTQTLAVNVRILSATNKNLIEEVKRGNFREDLYYRLNVIPITLPPLRSRRNDIPLLIEHFQHQFASKQGQDTQGISLQALRQFFNYHWPGNVRELENSIEHAVILSKGRQIEVHHLPSMLTDTQDGRNETPTQGTLMDNEKRAVIKALEEQNWNKSKAAIQLNISRSALYDKIKKYRISKPAE